MVIYETNTRFLGRLAPIFYLNCKHVLFLYILKQKQKKVRKFHEKISRILKIYWKSNFVRGIHKKSLQIIKIF